MPIRFRCPHCNQLMGIARRKAGSMVNCPTCNTPVLVPATDEAEEDSPAPAPATAPPPAPAAPAQPRELFERDDFDAFLGTAASGVAEPRSHAPGSLHAPGPAAPERERPASAPPRRDPVHAPTWNPSPMLPAPSALASESIGGVVLSPTKATILTVVVILLLAIAFGSGLIVGRFYL